VCTAAPCGSTVFPPGRYNRRLVLLCSPLVWKRGDGFTRQLQAIRAYAEAHGIRIMKVFQENGVSGAKDLENRPAFIELMEALHADGVKLVLAEKLDRLARDLMIQESILRDLKITASH